MAPRAERRRLRVLVCPQEFKGSLTAEEATRAIAAGVGRALPEAEVREAPMADGGPGTARLVCAAAGGRMVEGRWRGPLGEPAESAYALLPDGTAVVEAATTAGLLLVPPARRDPSLASTYGVGEQLRDALRRGSRRVVVGVGGTATNDGGAGAAQALGYRLLDREGRELPPGGLALARLARIESGEAEPRLREVEVRVAVDVTNRLLGPEGATAVYGPQKGATPDLAPRLEAALARWAERCLLDLGIEIAAVEGGGAGGGLAAGLVAVAGGRIESGAALVARAVGLAERIAAADLVVTGEGQVDAQTVYGKTVAHVADLARAAGRPCLVVAGAVEGIPDGIAAVERATPVGTAPEEAVARAGELVAAAAERLLRRYVTATGGA